jgi:hypothetical protein
MSDPNEGHAVVYVVLGIVWLLILFFLFWVLI